MMSVFSYKNIITALAFITIWCVLSLIWQIHISSDTGNRYQIVNLSDNTILLDKRTGLTWRNVWNNNKDKLPTNWERMIYEGGDISVPVGEQQIRKQAIWKQPEEVDYSKMSDTELIRLANDMEKNKKNK